MRKVWKLVENDARDRRMFLALFADRFAKQILPVLAFIVLVQLLTGNRSWMPAESAIVQDDQQTHAIYLLDNKDGMATIFDYTAVRVRLVPADELQDRQTCDDQSQHWAFRPVSFTSVHLGMRLRRLIPDALDSAHRLARTATADCCSVSRA
ncbi:hypothetical protein NKG94_40435 [Micromonospora sp. M12]